MHKTLSRSHSLNRGIVFTRNEYMVENGISKPLGSFAFDFPSKSIGRSMILNADCLLWMKQVPESSFHAIVTDPPYGVKEYDADQLQKRAEGKGGVWRIPPAFDGHQRSPLPRFTALDKKERQRISEFFTEWTRLAVNILRPGGHLFIATNSFMSQLVYGALVDGGLEFRGEIVRLVQTLRGGDRPKNAEREFPNVCSMPRGCFEPWGLFRKPMPPRMTVADCLREFQTGGLRRLPDGNPFKDVIPSERTPQRERRIADHPSLKPQSFLRHLVYVCLPLGEGVLLDPFMGSGSTVAAAEHLGLQCVGIERDSQFYQMAEHAIPKLVRFEIAPAEKEEIVEGQLRLLEEVPLSDDKSSSLPSSRIHYGSR